MNRLKELTLENHRKAERSRFAKKLLKGLTPEEYHRYLVNQHEIYMALEVFAHKIIDEFPEIQRSLRIADDIVELEHEYDIKWHPNLLCDVVDEYRKHVSKLNRNGLLAHIYVRHFGDMYGGQIIRSRNPGSGKMYDFANVEELKAKVRSMLDDSMADEANKCFEFAMKLFEELDNEYSLG